MNSFNNFDESSKSMFKSMFKAWGVMAVVAVVLNLAFIAGAVYIVKAIWFS